MSDDSDVSFESRLDSLTKRYLQTTRECVHLLPELLSVYADGGEYRAIAREIRTLETECDKTNREIRRLFSNATAEDFGLRNTRIYLNLHQILETYQRIDTVANAVERIADELVTIRPPRVEPYFGQFEEMATYATTAVDALEEMMAAFTLSLREGGRTETIGEAIHVIREAESSCDTSRNDLLEDVFGDESVERPLLYREFALLFDRLVDAIEDVTDHLVLVASDESWSDTEATLEG